MPMLDLNDLGDGSIPAVTPALGNLLAEAGGVCLESQGHTQGVRLNVRGYRANSYALTWQSITSEQARRTWNNHIRATELGAEGIAVLLARREIGHEVIESSWIGTGFDYWLGDESDTTLQRKARLEVSGIRQGNDRTIRERVRGKLVQTNPSDPSQLPAYVIVVAFEIPIAEVQMK